MTDGVTPERTVAVELSMSSYRALMALVANSRRIADPESAPVLAAAFAELQRPRVPLMDAQDAAEAMSDTLAEGVTAATAALRGDVAALTVWVVEAQEALDAWTEPAPSSPEQQASPAVISGPRRRP